MTAPVNESVPLVTVAFTAVGAMYAGCREPDAAPLGRPRGITMRPCRTTGSYFDPIAFRSPLVEWHEVQRPAPLKNASPPFGSPTRMSRIVYLSRLTDARIVAWRNAARSAICSVDN